MAYSLPPDAAALFLSAQPEQIVTVLESAPRGALADGAQLLAVDQPTGQVPAQAAIASATGPATSPQMLLPQAALAGAQALLNQTSRPLVEVEQSPAGLFPPARPVPIEGARTEPGHGEQFQARWAASALAQSRPNPDLAPLLEVPDLAPAMDLGDDLPVFTPLPPFSAPSITEPLIDFELLPGREQQVIPIAPGRPLPPLGMPGPAEEGENGAAQVSPEANPDANPQVSAEDNAANGTAILDADLDLLGVVQLDADRQSLDQGRQVISAEGEVLMRFQGGALSADRLQINLTSRIVVAEGNAALVRGQQRLRGDRIEYNLTQDRGLVRRASGELYTPTSDTDLLFDQPGPSGFVRPPSDRLTQNQPLSGLVNPGQITITTGFGTNFGPRDDVNDDNPTINPADTIQLPINISAFRQEGQINRWRFESDQLTLVPGGFDATDVRLTNDPFSPPQFEIRAEAVQVRSLSPLVDEILATKPRYVFEDKVAIPTFRNRILLDRTPRDDGLVTFGFDDRDRGGLYFERGFEPVSTERLRFNLTPQFYLQRSIFDEGGNVLSPRNYGLKAGLEANLRPGTSLEASTTLTTLALDDLADNTRGRVALRQALPLGHVLEVGYGYRNRVYNGSLGFRTVRQNYGAILLSPNFTLGNTGIVVNYQAGLQQITADTDRLELLDPIRDNNRVSLTRYQLGATANRGFTLWQGQALPATASEGLRYSPVPLTPSVVLSLGLTGLYSVYSNGDVQDSLTATAGLFGQLGHFSRPWLDYTAWNLVYSQAARGDNSPFQFDRIEDTRVLSFGLRQQLYGPIRIGLQSSLSLDTGERFSTDYTLEYSRRAYGIELRYNPVLQLGALTLRISDFDWRGGTDPFRAIAPSSP